ncbi:hypothetical protein K875_03840 [Mycobacterium [tuberculosis] TKK-01-0051]|uniref:Uncharacterized protein n=1 Tax=Mycobacterium [tuberculosis] TKK-01-0051 TaxID=1324261 RepID=A0A051TVD6_9MYCO|nr:hypothetical protein K875_03840 [Mycobacterium [tuberculosis] TKK-01-0051]
MHHCRSRFGTSNMLNPSKQNGHSYIFGGRSFRGLPPLARKPSPDGCCRGEGSRHRRCLACRRKTWRGRPAPSTVRVPQAEHGSRSVALLAKADGARSGCSHQPRPARPCLRPTDYRSCSGHQAGVLRARAWPGRPGWVSPRTAPGGRLRISAAKLFRSLWPTAQAPPAVPRRFSRTVLSPRFPLEFDGRASGTWLGAASRRPGCGYGRC